MVTTLGLRLTRTSVVAGRYGVVTPAEPVTLAECQNTQRSGSPASSLVECRTADFFIMNTWSNLWQPFITEENFNLAYLSAKKGKSQQKQVQRFELNPTDRLRRTRQAVIDGTFHTSKYKSKIIYEPKKRIIYILPFNPDRIVHHAIVNVLKPYYERYFIADSYACLDGRGQQAGSLRCMEAVRRNKYCLKCDIHHFYPSITHDLLFAQYKAKIRDIKFLELLEDNIYSFGGGKNTPIGNLTSIWHGNFFLTPLDLFCKHELKIHDYIRYCDDFLLFSDDKKYLHECRKRIDEFIHEKLNLEFSRSDVFNVKQGVDFLGYRHFDNYILVRKSTAKRMMKKVSVLPERYEAGELTQDELRSILDSISGWLSHANAYHLSQKMGLAEIRARYIVEN